jgi:hypothetical protein
VLRLGDGRLLFVSLFQVSALVDHSAAGANLDLRMRGPDCQGPAEPYIFVVALVCVGHLLKRRDGILGMIQYLAGSIQSIVSTAPPHGGACHGERAERSDKAAPVPISKRGLLHRREPEATRSLAPDLQGPGYQLSNRSILCWPSTVRTYPEAFSSTRASESSWVT